MAGRRELTVEDAANAAGPVPVGVLGQWLDVADRAAFTLAVGQVLRVGRVSLGWRLTDAAPHTGLSPSQLCRLELGARPISMGRLLTLCAALGLQPSAVIATAEREAFPIGSAPWTPDGSFWSAP